MELVNLPGGIYCIFMDLWHFSHYFIISWPREVNGSDLEIIISLLESYCADSLRIRSKIGVVMTIGVIFLKENGSQILFVCVVLERSKLHYEAIISHD